MGRAEAEPEDDLREAESGHEVSGELAAGGLHRSAQMAVEPRANRVLHFQHARRYYYKSKVLLPVFGRRLVYKFGPNATGWLPDNCGSVFQSG